MSETEWRNALSKDQERIPDLVEAILGYRSWWLRYKKGQWYLTSLRSRDNTWTPAKPYISKCPRENCVSNLDPDIAVAEGCEVCGVHVFNTLEAAEKYDGDVYGECKIWGEVIEHSDGYRAQLAAPHTLYLPSEFAHPEIINSLGSRYHVEIVAQPNNDLDIERLRLVHGKGLKRIKRDNALKYYEVYAYKAEPWYEGWHQNVDANTHMAFVTYDAEKDSKFSRQMMSFHSSTMGGLISDIDMQIMGTKRGVQHLPVLDLVSGQLYDRATRAKLGNIMDQERPPKPMPKPKKAKTQWPVPELGKLRPQRITKAELARPWRKRHPLLALGLIVMLAYTAVSGVMLYTIGSDNYNSGKQVLPGVPVQRVSEAASERVASENGGDKNAKNSETVKSTENTTNQEKK